MEERMRAQLSQRRENGSLRIPLPLESLEKEKLDRCDFSTNDYLGLAHCRRQKKLVDQLYQSQTSAVTTLGATGSRLLTGDSVYARNLEAWLAKLHNRPTATLFNSGYDANLSILSSTIMPDDLIILDDLCHNSLVMGVRMSRQQNYRMFAHNNVEALEQMLQLERTTPSRGCCLIVVESVYSMDGDVGPLKEILNLALIYNAKVVVDEAHGLGTYGRTNQQNLMLATTDARNAEEEDHLSYDNDGSLIGGGGGTGVLAALELEQHPALLCSVHTFGKAAGCHGAVICGSTVLRDYLWNYARPFVYSTAMPLHSLVAIEASYQTMLGREGERRRAEVFAHVKLFRSILSEALIGQEVNLWPSPSPIQALLMAGNETCIKFCRRVQERFQIRLYPIRAPTVPVGQERARIILHAHNTEEQIRYLCKSILVVLLEMGLVAVKSNL